MKRVFITAGVISAALVALSAMSPSGDGASQRAAAEPPPPSADLIQVSPLVLYTSAGGTLLGLELDQVIVYSNGLVVIAQAQAYTHTEGARMGQVEPADALALARSLREARALELGDQPTVVSDVPLKTLSLAHGTGPDIEMHSFSYWLANGEYAAVEDALEQWLIDHELRGNIPE